MLRLCASTTPPGADRTSRSAVSASLPSCMVVAGVDPAARVICAQDLRTVQPFVGIGGPLRWAVARLGVGEYRTDFLIGGAWPSRYRGGA